MSPRAWLFAIPISLVLWAIIIGLGKLIFVAI
jgi:hypothetical protein